MTITEQFARSMSLADAMDPDNLLCYEMNGEPLPPMHGFPVRLIAPGWYGIANVKWLQRIEVLDTRYEGRFMGRDYVTMREEQQDGETVARFTSVGRALLKSAPAKVTRLGRRLPDRRRGLGRADRPGRGADRRRGLAAGDARRRATARAFAWTVWSLDWGQPVRGRAHGHLAGHRQRRATSSRAMDDP